VRPAAHNAHPGDAGQSASQVAGDERGLDGGHIVEEDEHPDSGVVGDISAESSTRLTLVHNLEALFVDAADWAVDLEGACNAILSIVLGGGT